MTWRLFVDTGGTFTDCVAIDPDDGVHRAKVLGTARLRGRILDRSDRRAPRIELAIDVGDDVPRGFAVAAPGGSPSNLVAGFHAATGRLVLDAPLDARDAFGAALGDGAPIDLVAPFESPILAARLVTSTPGDRPLPPMTMRLATTRGTNALLERRGAPTALVTTAGFGDVLAIGDQRRPSLFVRRIVKPAPLPSLIFEVDERIDACGTVLRSLRDDAIARLVDEVRRSGVESVAVSLVHAWINPIHERTLVEALATAGIGRVVGAAALGPTIGFLDRTTAAAVDAFVGPALARHLAEVAAELDRGRGVEAGRRASAPATATRGAPPALLVMTSDAGLAAAERFIAKDGLLSGPAGGVLGAASAARRSGFERVIGFDMGGTSTDVARIDGAPPRRMGHRVGDAEIAAPAIAVETVAAGGGSVCEVRHGELVVGPHSAGASPGPACHGQGGPLTLTDVNLLLGRVDAARFGFPLDRAASERAASLVAARAAEAGRRFAAPEALLEAMIALADERMAEAIAAVSVRQGVDCRDHAILAFGGAGGVHACGVAERLGISTVLLPPDAGLLSAVGLAVATLRRVAVRSVLAVLDGPASAGAGCSVGDTAFAAIPSRLAIAVDSATHEARLALERDGGPPLDAPTALIARRITLRVRLLGQDACLDLEFDDDLPGSSVIADRFALAYVAMYGSEPPERPVEIESVRVAVEQVAEPLAALRPAPRAAAAAGSATTTTRAWFDGAWGSAPCGDVEAMNPGVAIDGPALLRQRHGSAWLPPGWTAAVDLHGAVVMRRRSAAGGDGASERSSGRIEVASLGGVARDEIVAARLTSIATEMGELLRRTAVSTNVKERLDFSCGLLDADGRLVVNAPHVPVHLGALGVCVRACDRVLPMAEGDIVLTNHPGFGGSHLPDLTVMAPVVVDGVRIGFVAARAHHAELGGVRPGSMPPDATSLADEAIVIPPTHLVRRGRARWDEIDSLLRTAAHPSRAVDDNLADLRAAVAACRHGADRLGALAAALGRAELARCTERLAEAAGSMARRALAALPNGRREAVERLDDGSILAATIDLEDGTARVDFTGTSGVHPANLNATEAIVRSAVMYVLRVLADAADGGAVWASGGLNEGLLRPVSIHVPFGMLSPRFARDPAGCPAVGAGNTETSQRLIDLLLKALGVMAAGQGTMNNLLFGRDARDGRPGYGYYETIGGGAGAGPGFDGADAVHVHMTNTRITDVEILEHRHPVRLERFAVRRGSGGRTASSDGRRCRRGGDGIVREIRFLDSMRVSLVTQRRASRPFGVPDGAGLDGAAGVNTLTRADGATLALGSSASIDVGPGDRVTIETPGGGGWLDEPPHDGR